MKAKDVPIEERKAAAKRLGMTLESINSRLNRGQEDWDTRPVSPKWRSEAGRRGRHAGGWGNNFKLPGSLR